MEMQRLRPHQTFHTTRPGRSRASVSEVWERIVSGVLIDGAMRPGASLVVLNSGATHCDNLSRTNHFALQRRRGARSRNGTRRLRDDFEHYRKLVRPVEAERYWSIRPQRAEKIVRLAAPA